MSIRANSLRSLIFDSASLVAVMCLFAAANTESSQGAEPSSERRADVTNDRRLTDDHIDSQLNTDDNMPAGNPAETAESKREAMMFGMKLVERSEGDIRVAEVAVTSPAWDAGIRRGDRLLSIATMKPQALSPWVEDVGKVLKETPDGQSIPAEIMRDHEKLSLRIRLAVSRAAEVRDARQEERALANLASGNQSGEQLGGQWMSGGAVSNADNGDFGNSGAGGWGIGGFFGESSGQTSDDRMANSAVAQLMAMNTISGGSENQSQTGQVQGAQGQQFQDAQAQSTQSAVGQVGIAAFQNNGQGVNAIVVVRGLPQGSYRVGIGQGHAFTGGFGGNQFEAGTIGNDQITNDPRNRPRQRSLNDNQLQNDRRTLDQQQMQNQQQMPGPQRPGAQLPAQGNQQTPFTPQRPGPGSVPAPGGATPAGGASPTGGGGPVSEGASLADPRGNAVLAQHLDPQQAQDVQGAALGQAQIPNANDLVDPRQNNLQGNQQGNFTNRQTGTRNGTQPMQNGDNQNGGLDNTGSTPFVTEIGILRVGSDGSGRVQRQLEGLTVRNLAGMSVTVVKAMSQGGGGFSQTNAVDPRTNAGQQGHNFPQNNSVSQNNAAAQQAGQNAASPGIVATGVIQVVEGGSVPNLGEERRGLNPGEERPVDEATRQQRNRSTISDPRQDFDPAQ